MIAVETKNIRIPYFTSWLKTSPIVTKKTEMNHRLVCVLHKFIGKNGSQNQCVIASTLCEYNCSFTIYEFLLFNQLTFK